MMKKLDAIILLSFVSVPSTIAALITPALPDIQLYYHATSSNINWVISFFMFGFMLGQMLYCPISNYYGRVKALRIGLMLNIVGILLSITSIYIENYSLLVLSRFVSSLGAAACLVCSTILINEGFTAQDAKRLFSFSIVSFVLGINLGVFLAGMITSYVGWQYCFALLLMQSIIMLLLTTRLSETLKPNETVGFNLTDIVNGYGEALFNKKLIQYSLILTVPTIISYVFAAQGMLIASQQLGLAAHSFGTWNLLNAFGMLIGGLLSARLLKSLEGITVIMIGFVLVITGISSLLIMMKTGLYLPIWFFSSTALLFCAMGLIYPSASFYASNSISKTGTANASGAMNFITMGIGSSVVFLMGQSHFNALANFFIALIGITIIAGISLWLRWESGDNLVTG